MCRTHQHRTTFASWDVEKVHAVVARSTFPSQNVNNTPCSDHFWKLRCRKSAHRCGAKRISKLKVLKTDGLGALLGVDMSKKCRPLWREAHFEVKSAKIWGYMEHFSTFGCRFAWQAHGILHLAKNEKKREGFIAVATTTTTTLRYTTLHHTTTLQYTTLHVQLKLQLHYIN